MRVCTREHLAYRLHLVHTSTPALLMLCGGDGKGHLSSDRVQTACAAKTTTAVTRVPTCALRMVEGRLWAASLRKGVSSSWAHVSLLAGSGWMHACRRHCCASVMTVLKDLSSIPTNANAAQMANAKAAQVQKKEGSQKQKSLPT